MTDKRMTEAERRKLRLAFYKDDVFVIAHKAIRKEPCCLSVEELFCQAERLVRHLLKYEITDEDFIDMEMDDWEAGCEEGEVAFLVLTIAFVKLCALRKVHPLASRVARALVHRCQQYERFTDLLGELSEAEQKHVVDKGRIDLLNYELKSIGEENMHQAYAEQQINEYINAALDCDVQVVKNVIVAFTAFNERFHHLYDKQLGILMQGYADKLAGKAVTKIEMNFNNPIGMVVAHTNGITL